MRTLAWPATGESGNFEAAISGTRAVSSCISPSMMRLVPVNSSRTSCMREMLSSFPPLPKEEKVKRAMRGSSGRRTWAAV